MGVFGTHIRELAYRVGAVAHEGAPTSAGSTTTIIDSSLVDTLDDVWIGYEAYVYTGTAIGEARRISDFVASSDTITVAPAFSAAPSAAGSSRYLILRKEWRVEVLRQAWIAALRDQRRKLLLPKVDDTSITLSAPDGNVTYAYNVPSGFYAIQHILREETAGSGKFIVEIPSDYYHINREATRQIVFDEPINRARNFMVDGCLLRIIGQQTETEPATDSSSLTVPTGGLSYLAAAIALESVAAYQEDQSRHLRAAENFRRMFRESSDRMLLLPGSKVVELN